ncbi:hypothetical protein KY495_11585 [Massilia sp. PAMC28688]|uniref:hypothetical protein n=1 Tax=Massilia sp. PAMC28688 TaxID=2861283 RepID=UPI001C628B5E|nr:hypothetical protein [Massilia sp. PAMC28688]QYF95732.1 hypothetical protein KY495_11585 [Massilia sp. PAMC28688]
MEVKTAAGSPIALMTLDRTMGGGKQQHKIRWVALPNCPDGYIIQRITRDTKITRGKVLRDNHGNPNGKFSWERTEVVRADYYELWEIWKGNVFPAKSSATGGGMYHSHDGLQSRAWFGDRYIDPDRAATRARSSAVLAAPASRAVGVAPAALVPAAAALPADVYHDIFSDSVPACTQGSVVKGSNKILGKVYFIPRDSALAAGFLSKYLSEGRRNLTWSNTFTGGILLQFDASAIAEPDARFLQITRYEAIAFNGSYSKKSIADRGYPGIMRKKGQGVVNAHNANVIYGPGTAVGPAGQAEV